jgi:hypothetical protein
VLISRTLNRFIARLLLGVMLFTQLTVAAYACTGPQSMSAVAAGTELTLAGLPMAASADAVLGHAAMDPTQPNLCASHCQSGGQNADGKPAPNVSPAIPVSLYPRALALLPADIQLTSTAPDGPLASADPPHAILHCCFRI